MIRFEVFDRHKKVGFVCEKRRLKIDRASVR